MTEYSVKPGESQAPINQRLYVVDTRPLCEGMPFLLTDAAHPRLILKHGSHFLALDQSGIMPACNTLGYGYYRYDTRHISQWEIYLNDVPLSLLSSSVEDGFAGVFLYTNPKTLDIQQQTIMMQAEVVLADCLWERISLQNFNASPVTVDLTFKFQSDFADMFEVRGLNLDTRGQRMIPQAGTDGQRLFLAYRGQDKILLETDIHFIGMRPDQIREGEVTFKLDLPVRERIGFEIQVITRTDGHSSSSNQEETKDFADALNGARQHYQEWRRHGTSIGTDHEIVDIALDRGFRDIYILRQPTPGGWGLAAGIPWYAAIFGRDSAITASQLIPFHPEVARESILVLAHYQGRKQDQFRSEEPGRILHELRLGELARSGRIPHSPYYGTVDATQLWLELICQYIEWTGDLDFAKELWPNVKLAVNWLEKATSDGYITYQSLEHHHLVNQGWKDSGDAIMHEDGCLAEPPIAVCEAQGYLYAAQTRLSALAELLGHRQMASRLRSCAAGLKTQFQKDFWMEAEGYIALALDGKGKQVKVLSSNPGHLLSTGILDDDKAQLVAERLMSRDLHSGWGIRTLSSTTVAYNPMSYHNGSVWPHDNSMIAEGMSKIGRISDAHNIFRSILDVAQREPDFRLPELLCGFTRDGASHPIDYPVSCSPQAWAAGSLFQLLKTCINLQPDAVHDRIRIVEPALPEWLKKLTISGLRIGQSRLDLGFTTTDGSTFCQILSKSGKVRVIIET